MEGQVPDQEFPTGHLPKEQVVPGLNESQYKLDNPDIDDEVGPEKQAKVKRQKNAEKYAFHFFNTNYNDRFIYANL